MKSYVLRIRNGQFKWRWNETLMMIKIVFGQTVEKRCRSNDHPCWCWGSDSIDVICNDIFADHSINLTDDALDPILQFSSCIRLLIKDHPLDDIDITRILRDLNLPIWPVEQVSIDLWLNASETYQKETSLFLLLCDRWHHPAEVTVHRGRLLQIGWKELL